VGDEGGDVKVMRRLHSQPCRAKKERAEAATYSQLGRLVSCRAQEVEADRHADRPTLQQCMHMHSHCNDQTLQVLNTTQVYCTVRSCQGLHIVSMPL
jgi:hypothetical protein